MQITKEQLKKWSACCDGYGWFLDKFPAGAAPYADVMAALNADGRRADVGWLVDNAYAEWANNPEFIRAETAATDVMVAELTALQVDEHAEGVENSSGYGARIGSSGYGAQIGSSGYGAQIGSSGDYARIGSSGYDAQIGSSGNDAQIGTSGYGAQIDATGENPVVACAGTGAMFSLGTGGCAAVPYEDGDGRIRFAIAYEGENIEAGKRYRVNNAGEFVLIEEN